MEDVARTQNFVCVDGTPCRMYASGHHTHAVHWGRAAATSEMFVWVLVRNVDDHTVELEFADADIRRFWNHEHLSGLLDVGERIRFHPRYHILEVRGRWLNVASPGDSEHFPDEMPISLC